MSKSDPKKDHKAAKDDSFQIPDPVVLGHALVDAYEQAQPLIDDYFKKLENKDLEEWLSPAIIDPLNVREAYVEFMDKLAADPSKFLEIQSAYLQEWMGLWQESMNRFMGEKVGDVVKVDDGDRRFRAPEWQESALFDFIKQSYLLTCRYMDKVVQDTEGLTPQQRDKLALQTRLFTNALSPTNFIMTNPEVLSETMRTGGRNLVKGLENLIKDMERGQGEWHLTTTDPTAFEVGKNIAITPGSVVFENDLMQLIQYAPSTDDVYKTPLLIIPPWINKYYILDLSPGKSFVEWAVAQGHTVFIISWVNPDKSLAQKGFDDYMKDGVLAALNQVERITGETKTNMIGYCLGGTLLATTLAWMTEKKQDKRIASATFFTTLLDFEHSGDIKLFLDDEQLDFIEQGMKERGFHEGKEIQKTFSLLRANDMIWSFVVNNYLMGKEPFPFDLLSWNDDCTNMPAAMHSFYLRNMYRDNKLIKKNGIEIDGVKIDLTKIKTPAYFLSTKEDHIAPWIATYEGPKTLGGDNCFTLAASGHIAGVVNPPQKHKYCYWTNKSLPPDHDAWLDSAEQHDGSWWPHWQTWVSDFGGEKIKARKAKNEIEPAPGRYVKVRL